MIDLAELMDPPPADPSEPGESGPRPSSSSQLAIPAIASAAAAVLHGAAAGIHADHPQLARVFIALALAQAAAAVAGFVRSDRLAGLALVGVNLVAVAGWITTRLSGIAWIDGLEVAERPQLADTTSAILAAVAVAAAVAAASPRARPVPARAITNAAILAGVIAVPGLVDTTNHSHAGVDHSHETTVTATGGTPISDDGHTHPAGTATGATTGTATGPTGSTVPAGSGIGSGGDIDAALGQLLTGGEGLPEHTHDADTSWPRAWDPTLPIDFSGVAGVSADQQARAEQLVVDTLRDLPSFADVTSVGALGYQSIGDASTGVEHYVNYSLLGDDKFLDPTAPESLVYRVDGADRTLVSAMFIAGNTALDDPELLDYAGPLMQWHIHDNLCWGLDANGRPTVVDVLESPGDTCPPRTVNAGSENPMVHVWIVAHPCGPFAALEGHGAGQTAVEEGDRVDQCAHDHPTTTGGTAPATTIGGTASNLGIP